jgi:hypothetical protein
MSKDTFYVIKLVSDKTDEDGFVIEDKEGIKVVSGAFHTDVTQYKDYNKALHALRRIKPEAHGFKSYILSNTALINDLKMRHGDQLKEAAGMVYIENEAGEKLHFNSKEEAYFFDPRDIGYPVWKTRSEAEFFLKMKGIENGIVKEIKK